MTDEESSRLLDVIEWCEAALVNYFPIDDGLYSAYGRTVARVASETLASHGRVSAMVELDNRKEGTT